MPFNGTIGDLCLKIGGPVIGVIGLLFGSNWLSRRRQEAIDRAVEKARTEECEKAQQVVADLQRELTELRKVTDIPNRVYRDQKTGFYYLRSVSGEEVSDGPFCTGCSKPHNSPPMLQPLVKNGNFFSCQSCSRTFNSSDGTTYIPRIIG